MTKDSLTYADVEQCLMDTDTPESAEDSALFASKPSGHKKKGKKLNNNNNSSSSSSSTSKVCTWCKKHNAGKSEGYTSNVSFYFQKMNKEKREKEQEKPKEEANITTESKVRN